MNPLIFNLGPTELIIILVIVLLLFGGSRLAGLGKSTGRALKEFKEETKDLGKKDDSSASTPPAVEPPTQWSQPPNQNVSNQNVSSQNVPSQGVPDQTSSSDVRKDS